MSADAGYRENLMGFEPKTAQSPLVCKRCLYISLRKSYQANVSREDSPPWHFRGAPVGTPRTDGAFTGAEA